MVDPENAILTRIVGWFYPIPRSVQVIYTAGFPVAGAGVTQAIQVPEDLNEGCCLQSAYEFAEAEPGFIPAGATTVSRPDGSVVVPAQKWLTRVQDILDACDR